MGNPFKLVKRCFRCLHVLRDDDTCQNPKCSRYVEENAETKDNKNETNDKSNEANK